MTDNKNTCDIRCKTAVSNKCMCSCNGKNHGKQSMLGKNYECDKCGDKFDLSFIEFGTIEAPETDDYADYYIYRICVDCYKKKFDDVKMLEGDEL